MIAISIEKNERHADRKRIHVGIHDERGAQGIRHPLPRSTRVRPTARAPCTGRASAARQFYGDLSSGDGLVSQITVGLCEVKQYDGGVNLTHTPAGAASAE